MIFKRDPWHEGILHCAASELVQGHTVRLKRSDKTASPFQWLKRQFVTEPQTFGQFLVDLYVALGFSQW